MTDLFSENLAQAFGRVAATAVEAKVSLDDLINIFKYNQDREPDVVANAVKSLLTRIRKPEVLKILEEIGFQTLNTPIQILRNVARIFNHLSNEAKTKIEVNLGSFFQLKMIRKAENYE